MSRELYRLKLQLAVLRDVAEDYSGRTIENIMTNIEARIKYHEEEEG